MSTVAIRRPEKGSPQHQSILYSETSRIAGEYTFTTTGSAFGYYEPPYSGIPWTIQGEAQGKRAALQDMLMDAELAHLESTPPIFSRVSV
jgi:hypothetical protein